MIQPIYFPSVNYENYKDLIIDKAFVLTPVDSHYEICSHFLGKGVDVFCEKPLASSSDQAERLYKKAKLRGCSLFVDWIFTFNNQEFETLKVRKLKKKTIKL